MSLKRVRRNRVVIGLIAFLALSSVFVAQQQQPPTQQKEQKPPAKSQNVDKYDEVHRGIFTPAPDKAREAGRFTEEVSKALVGKPVAGKLPRKNFIDEYIFGKMEKDGIPYAGLSTDEEFVRR